MARCTWIYRQANLTITITITITMIFTGDIVTGACDWRRFDELRRRWALEWRLGIICFLLLLVSFCFVFVIIFVSTCIWGSLIYCCYCYCYCWPIRKPDWGVRCAARRGEGGKRRTGDCVLAPSSARALAWSWCSWSVYDRCMIIMMINFSAQNGRKVTQINCWFFLKAPVPK